MSSFTALDSIFIFKIIKGSQLIVELKQQSFVLAFLLVKPGQFAIVGVVDTWLTASATAVFRVRLLGFILQACT